MEFLLIRHGQKKTDLYFNPKIQRNDPPLSNLGIQQAKETAKYLQRLHIDLLYSSDMARTVETATIISQKINIPFNIEPELREIHFGDLEKIGWDQFEVFNPEYYKKWKTHSEDLPYPNGENGQKAFSRIYPFVNELVNLNKKCEKTIIALVTHGGMIRVLICGLLNIPYNARFFMGNPLYNCSITRISFNKITERYYLQDFNNICHINPLKKTG